VVSAFYYLRLVKAAFFDEAAEGERTIPQGYRVSRALCADISLVIIVLLIVVLGPLSGMLLNWFMAF
jgi:NADH:ubiquinone oxidoreductase subunit 2 (subunit N)